MALGRETAGDLALVDQWRASHGYVINTFQIFFKRRIERMGTHAEFAQRLKRRRTVVDKLRRVRENGAPLISDVTSMHDFAGCRLIFDNIEELTQFRNYVNSPEAMSNVNHKLKHDTEKYDYIARPKDSGYRGIHDVFVHYPRPHRREGGGSEKWHGLLVEVQYRTRVQHAWATALEISDIIDGQRTKFDLLGTDRARFFALASEILARYHENVFNAFSGIETDELIVELIQHETNLGILGRLETLREFGGFENIKRHTILNITTNPEGDLNLEVLNFRNASLAILKANELEMDPASINAVYVSAENPSQLRSAYRNYFNDPLDFVRLLTEAM